MATSPLLARWEGENDGLVSTTSARWGEYVGTVNADHIDFINFPFKLRDRTPMPLIWDFIAQLSQLPAGAPLPELPPDIALRGAAEYGRVPGGAA